MTFQFTKKRQWHMPHNTAKAEEFVFLLGILDENIPKYDGLGMLICQAIESFNIWTSADLIVTSIYDEVFKQLEVQND